MTAGHSVKQAPAVLHPLSYVNKRGERVSIDVTGHARSRFRERWQHAFPKLPLPGNLALELQQWFLKARRMEPTSRKYQTRLRRYGKDTLYFSAQPFVFVVQSACLRTVELASRETRPLNKVPLENYSSTIHPNVHAEADHADSDSEDPITSDDVIDNGNGNRNGMVLELKADVQIATSESKSFKLLACATDPARSMRFVNLGSYPSVGTNGIVQKLVEDELFLMTVRERFQLKKPDWVLLAVYAALGKQGEQIKVFDEFPAA